MNKKLVSILVGAFICTASMAQVYPTIGQFQTTQLYFNPAYAGASSSLRANLLHRSQWSKFPGAPNTQLLTMDLPLARNLGGGIVLYRHQVGNLIDLSLNANISYRLKINENSYFQFGLKLGVSNINNGINDAFRWDDGDSYLNTIATRGTMIRIGPGGYYKRKYFYAGLSSPDLIFLDPQKIYNDPITNKTTLKRNIFFVTGTRKSLSEFIAIQPNFLVKYYVGRPMNLYMNLGFEFNQTFTAGVGLVYPLGYGVYTRVAVSPKLKLGFRYELASKSFQLGSYGSSEIMLSYGFNN